MRLPSQLMNMPSEAALDLRRKLLADSTWEQFEEVGWRIDLCDDARGSSWLRVMVANDDAGAVTKEPASGRQLRTWLLTMGLVLYSESHVEVVLRIVPYDE